MILVKHQDTISPFENILGYYEGKVNEQITKYLFSIWKIAMETLMLKCQPDMEKATGLNYIQLILMQESIKKVMIQLFKKTQR